MEKLCLPIMTRIMVCPVKQNILNYMYTFNRNCSCIQTHQQTMMDDLLHLHPACHLRNVVSGGKELALVYNYGSHALYIMK